MEKILVYRVKELAAVRKIADQMKMRVQEIEVTSLRQTIGAIAGNGQLQLVAPYQGSEPQESLMVFCNLSEKHLDRILFLLRQKGIMTDYKAIMTPTNEKWTVLQLLVELEREKREIGK